MKSEKNGVLKATLIYFELISVMFSLSRCNGLFIKTLCCLEEGFERCMVCHIPHYISISIYNSQSPTI